MAPIRVGVGQPFEARLDIVNVSKKPCILVCIEGLFPSKLEIRILNEELAVHNHEVDLKNRELEPFSAASFKFELVSEAAEKFSFKPQIVYIDDDGVIKKQDSNQVEVTVGSTIYAKIGHQNISVPILAGRVKTGLTDLDGLLFGGIPEHYAVALNSPSTDERQLLIKRFLEAGAETGETVAHIANGAENAKILAAKYPKNFFLFLCNPQADSIIQDSPNVYKVKGVENLTEIDIAIAKAFRNSDQLVSGTKRACIEIVSDALLQHRVVNTRRWLSALIPTLKSKGFTILAVIDTGVVSPEELQAILGVFDGEIRVLAKETPKGTIQTLKVKKLCNQKYLEDEIILGKENR